MLMSGLPEIVASVTATATFEGENYVLWQQVGRYLFKCVDRLTQGFDIDPNMAYLQRGYQKLMSLDCLLSGQGGCEARGREFLDHSTQLSIYRDRALRHILSTYNTLRSSSKSAMEAWNEHMFSIIGAARCHTEYMVLSAFVEGIEELPDLTSPSLKAVLNRLCSLFALSNIINPTTTNAISFIEGDIPYLSLTQLNTIRGLLNELLEALLPDVIALTDAWDFTDASLCSAIGMYDGNVYDNIMRWVEQMPINQKAWTENKGVYQPGWKRWIDPFLKAKL